MPFEIIPRPQWRAFLESFSRIHRGWLVTVSSTTAAGVLMREVPLASVLSENGDIVIAAALKRQHTDHVVERPVTLRVERTADGADRQLEIVGADGEVVQMRFRSAVRPELVDGI